MRKTSIIDYLNCKTLAYTTVCKENEDKKKSEEKWMVIKIFRYQLSKKTNEASNTNVACDDTL